jgi:hypothetical protein
LEYIHTYIFVFCKLSAVNVLQKWDVATPTDHDTDDGVRRGVTESGDIEGAVFHPVVLEPSNLSVKSFTTVTAIY